MRFAEQGNGVGEAERDVLTAVRGAVLRPHWPRAGPARSFSGKVAHRGDRPHLWMRGTRGVGTGFLWLLDQITQCSGLKQHGYFFPFEL